MMRLSHVGGIRSSAQKSPSGTRGSRVEVCSSTRLGKEQDPAHGSHGNAVAGALRRRTWIRDARTARRTGSCVSARSAGSSVGSTTRRLLALIAPMRCSTNATTRAIGVGHEADQHEHQRDRDDQDDARDDLDVQRVGGVRADERALVLVRSGRSPESRRSRGFRALSTIATSGTTWLIVPHVRSWSRSDGLRLRRVAVGRPSDMVFLLRVRSPITRPLTPLNHARADLLFRLRGRVRDASGAGRVRP